MATIYIKGKKSDFTSLVAARQWLAEQGKKKKATTRTRKTTEKDSD